MSVEEPMRLIAIFLPLRSAAERMLLFTTSWNGSWFEMPPMKTTSAPWTAAAATGV